MGLDLAAAGKYHSTYSNFWPRAGPEQLSSIIEPDSFSTQLFITFESLLRLRGWPNAAVTSSPLCRKQ
jgi:hypothetical protein